MGGGYTEVAVWRGYGWADMLAIVFTLDPRNDLSTVSDFERVSDVG